MPTPQVTGALRARATNGATSFDETALAFQKRRKKFFCAGAFRSRRAALAENLCVALNTTSSLRMRPHIAKQLLLRQRRRGEERNLGALIGRELEGKDR